MDNIQTFNPKRGVPATENERTYFRNGYGVGIGVIYLPSKNMPEMFSQNCPTMEVRDETVHAAPEFRIFETKKSAVRIFQYNPVQFHLKEHDINGIQLFHLLVACLDGNPEPFSGETTLNPGDPLAARFLEVMAESPYFAINTYVKFEYCQTFFADNPFREMVRSFKFTENPQPKDVFMRAKAELERAVPFKYREFDWEPPQKTLRINFV
ncbi:hypothetical protein ERICII_02616 [Paenibacillus larvae subsp. larvae DSM 25430]|nr:hypothetical protein ERICII_02616 [Paenibacillus larvae subsp. larvae DSM 25430]